MGAMVSQITGLTIVLLNLLFRHRSKKISKVRDTALSEGNSPMTGEFPAQRFRYAENVSIWWRHHVIQSLCFRTETTCITDGIVNKSTLTSY